METMATLFPHVESTSYPYYIAKKDTSSDTTLIPDAICGSSIFLAEKTNASAIAVMTASGYTAFEISSFRPNANIYVFTGNTKLLNQLSLVWGVRTFIYEKYESTDGTIQDVNELLKKIELVEPGQIVINTASTPLHEKGKTNTIRVSVVN